ncbi:MAG: DUF2274 domain-containing protein [Bradyrhizobium sp.]|nr:DUF2274 domain-containing protein [Pseudomonadota bacterium]MDE2472910.1 DUF2274 domain-containing protein [Bradyrhizobium sp.]
MARLKLSIIDNDKPVKVAHQLPASVHRDFVTYAKVLARQSGQPINDPVKLIAPMLARFMATDRAFATARRPKAPMDSASTVTRCHLPACWIKHGPSQHSATRPKVRPPL